MNFINQEFTFTISGLALVGVGIFTLISFVAIVYLFSKLIYKIRSLEKPRYGFLGKPVYSLLAVMIMVGGLGFFSYSFTQQQDFQIQAAKTVDLDVQTKVVLSDTQQSVVEFKAIPFVDNIAWGKSTDKFEIYWNIRGPENVDKFEFDRSRENSSQFTESLDKGSYTLRIVVVYENKSYTFNEVLAI